MNFYHIGLECDSDIMERGACGYFVAVGGSTVYSYRTNDGILSKGKAAITPVSIVPDWSGLIMMLL